MEKQALDTACISVTKKASDKEAEMSKEMKSIPKLRMATNRLIDRNWSLFQLHAVLKTVTTQVALPLVLSTLDYILGGGGKLVKNQDIAQNGHAATKAQNLIHSYMSLKDNNSTDAFWSRDNRYQRLSTRRWQWKGTTVYLKGNKKKRWWKVFGQMIMENGRAATQIAFFYCAMDAWNQFK